MRPTALVCELEPESFALTKSLVRYCRTGAIAAAVVCLLPAAARAGGGAEADPYDDIPGERRLGASALLDIYVAHNFNQPQTNTNQLRQFDLKSDTPALNFARVSVAWRPRRIGFRIDAGIGDTADVYFAQDPASATHPELARWLSHVEQAFVTVVPWRAHLAIDVGKFNTPVGLEDNETPTNWNYSRSLIFTFAEPTLHTGLRVTWLAARSLVLAMFWLNGWNANILDGNEMRSFALAATWKPFAHFEVTLVEAGGLEHAPTMLADPRLTFRNVVDASVLWSPRRWLDVAASADWGWDHAGGGVQFWGIDGYARTRPLSWLAFAARGEYFADPDGFTTGTRQRVAAGTFTLDLQHRIDAVDLTLRLEYRHDQSNALVFERGDRSNSTRTQDTLTVALTAAL